MARLDQITCMFKSHNRIQSDSFAPVKPVDCCKAVLQLLLFAIIYTVFQLCISPFLFAHLVYCACSSWPLMNLSVGCRI